MRRRSDTAIHPTTSQYWQPSGCTTTTYTPPYHTHTSKMFHTPPILPVIMTFFKYQSLSSHASPPSSFLTPSFCHHVHIRPLLDHTVNHESHRRVENIVHRPYYNRWKRLRELNITQHTNNHGVIVDNFLHYHRFSRKQSFWRLDISAEDIPLPVPSEALNIPAAHIHQL